jgi:hypothetical protein
MHAYKASFSLEHEWKAHKELKEYIGKMWKRRAPFYDQLKKENAQVHLYIRQQNVKLISPECKDAKDLEDLFKKTMEEIVNSDPVLDSIYIFNSIEPEDLQTRIWVRSFLTEEKISPYGDLFKIDLLKGSGLVRIGKSALSGVPLPAFVVGQIIDGLLGDFEHFMYIDAVKETGIEDSIEELRRSRVYENEWGIFWDYSPIIRIQITKSGITSEVFTEEDFNQLRKDRKHFSNFVDEFLCFVIREAGSDPRRDMFFGRFPPIFRYVVRYQAKEIFIALELWPKWKSRIEKEAGKHTLTLIDQKTSEEDKIEQKKLKEDEQQEAMVGLFRGALSWSEQKGPAASWLRQNIQWQLGKAFERLSTEDRVEIRVEMDAYEFFGGDEERAKKWFQRRILMEKTDQSGGRLDEPITQDNQGEEEGDEPITRKESLSASRKHDQEEEKNLNAISVKELLKEAPELSEILEKERNGEPLSDRDRKIKSRAVEHLGKKYEP